MELCDYGCGQEAKYKFKNGKKCCSEKYRSCPFQATMIGKMRSGTHHTLETREKIGRAHKGKIPWHKGKTGVYSPETLAKMSNAKKGKRRNSIPWNKGLTKDQDARIACGDKVRHVGVLNGMYGKTHTEEVKLFLSEKNTKMGKWCGSDNPWFGKDRSGENSPRFLTDDVRTEWESYRNVVRSLTERTYVANKDVINPSNLERSTTEYHLDHIIPIWYGFMNNIDPEILSLVDNLRMLRWDDNIKRSKVALTEQELEFLNNLITNIKRTIT